MDNKQMCEKCAYYGYDRLCTNFDSIHVGTLVVKDYYCDWYKEKEISGLQCFIDIIH